MGNHHAIARKLINEQITPEEERAYMTWVMTRPADEIKALQEYRAAMQFRRSPDENARRKSAWAYVVGALQARQ